ncbi:MAG: MmcQ/YjbR family DNA-binding protein [Polyangiaceae bacterium]
MPDAVEKSHFGHADFRIANKIFAGLAPKDAEHASLKMDSTTQATLLAQRPTVFTAAAGAWGRSGWTYVDLAQVKLSELRPLVEQAYRIVAPPRTQKNAPKLGKIDAGVAAYLAKLPPERRRALEACRQVILQNLDGDYEEGIQYGMIGYFVPHRVFPAGYHTDPKQPLPFAALASQKQHMAVYLNCVYVSGDAEQRFRERWAKTGKKLDMGKSCIRFPLAR